MPAPVFSSCPWSPPHQRSFFLPRALVSSLLTSSGQSSRVCPSGSHGLGPQPRGRFRGAQTGFCGDAEPVWPPCWGRRQIRPSAPSLKRSGPSGGWNGKRWLQRQLKERHIPEDWKPRAGSDSLGLGVPEEAPRGDGDVRTGHRGVSRSAPGWGGHIGGGGKAGARHKCGRGGGMFRAPWMCSGLLGHSQIVLGLLAV